ncbi:SPFH domain-containing protein [Paroceanicella profunda]|uniref:SPFH domain-containing protein n=1 Tax=Paroceanicella profunda TaxID=2579971 RepID=A0A5B8FQB6_9RHOB|nr:SPFH domain-containing protein [Paroceanicella profunda]QDL90555.1 SPFH domain-containing protein [Paroceanicella profunda]
MGLFDFLSGQFIDVIEWTDDTRDTMVWRFPRYGHEIKYGAKLTVREGQAAVFVHEGKLADVFTPGLYMLETNNMPVMTSLQHWDHGFRSPFKSEIYYVSTVRFQDLKWGTRNPIICRDPEFGPVRLRAFGTYTVRVKDPALFLREIVGTDGEFTTDEVTSQLRNIIVSRFTNKIAASGIPVLDMAANTDELGRLLRDRIAPELEAFGLEMPALFVENISLPDEVEKALDRRTSMGVAGDLSRWTEFNAAEAMRDAARTPGSDMGAGLGIGMGMEMSRRMAAATAPGPAAPPPPPEPERVWHIAERGETKGPFSKAALGRMAGTGALTRATLVWSPGLDGWTAAGEIDELARLFTVMPPPPPPPPAPEG